LRINVRTVVPKDAVEEVASGRADVALVDGITAPDNPLALAEAGLLSSTALVELPLVVALPIGHPLQHRRSVDLEVLVDAPWVVAPIGAFGAGKVAPLVYEGGDLPTLLDLIAADHGAALLPAPACRNAKGIVAIPLRSPRLVHRTEMLTLRTLTAGQRRLVEALQARTELI
jgi:DNA-binding transcriptional LysR family regulator